MTDSNNTDTYDIVLARGDLAMVSLQAIRSATQNAQIRLLSTVNRLQKMKLPVTTDDGKPTVASAIMTEMEIVNTVLTDVFAIANTVVEEINALAEQHNVARPLDETIAAVVGYIRQTSPIYADKTDDEIRKGFGL